MRLLSCLLLVLFSGQVGANYCYQLIKGNEIVYQESSPPFDISYSVEDGASDEMRRSQAKGENLVFFSGSCTAGRGRGGPAFVASRSGMQDQGGWESGRTNP